MILLFLREEEACKIKFELLLELFAPFIIRDRTFICLLKYDEKTCVAPSWRKYLESRK